MQKLDDDGSWNCPTRATRLISHGETRQMWSGHVLKDINIFDNFLSDDLLQDTLMFFTKRKRNHGNWEYTGFSLDPNAAIFWNMDLQHFTLFTDTILKHIESKTGKRFELLDVYANGQTLGQDGTWHQDNHIPGMYTFLLYMTYLPEIVDSTNYKTFGGCTKFKLNRMITDVEPFTNRGVLFKSEVRHAGLAPQPANTLRVSIAYKLKEIT
tara:strand:+ start:366 stop:998 length:633 start_codon:yes stop_codon:yes gene_type:complete